MMPEKFNNKTNGITQRRFLLHGNPLEADWVTSKIGDQWITDLPHIAELLPCAEDKACQREFMELSTKTRSALLRTLRSTMELT